MHNIHEEKVMCENTSPCTVIIFFNLLKALRHVVKVIFSLGPMIANGDEVVSI